MVRSVGTARTCAAVLHAPYQLVGGVRFYDRKEIKRHYAYLRIVYQPSDRLSFSRIVNVPTGYWRHES